MFSKNRRMAIVILSVISTILLFFGLWANDIARKNREYRDSLGYDGNGNFIAETVPLAGATEDVTDEQFAETEEEETFFTTEKIPDDEIIDDEKEAIKSDYALYSKRAMQFSILSIVLLMLGLILTGMNVILLRKYGCMLTLEGAVVLLALLTGRVMRTDNSSIMQMALLIIYVFLLPYALHDIQRWITEKFTIEENISHRFGVFFSKWLGKPHAYLVVSMIWLMICMTGIFISFYWIRVYESYGNGFQRIMMLAISILFFLLAIAVLARYLMAVSHLDRQIQRLSSGETPIVSDGIYEETEKKLLDLKSERDAAIDHAVKSERFKVDLITNVSHDLRTPLTSILGYGELLCSEQLSEEGKVRLEQLNKKAGYMRDLVDELFELTKVSSGVIEPKMDEIDLVKLIEQTIGLFEDKLNAGKLTIKRHYCSDHLQLRSDGAMLHQVFANLLGNAIKYSPTDSRIHIRMICEEGRVQIRMSNISSYEMDFTAEEIVQRFVRGDKARSTTGSGLGLAIAKTYTDAVGGEFHIEIDDERFVAIVDLPAN